MWYVNFNHKSYPFISEEEARSFAKFWNLQAPEFKVKQTSYTW
jgi:hypothetical protein